jgi:hypothetical protein
VIGSEPLVRAGPIEHCIQVRQHRYPIIKSCEHPKESCLPASIRSQQAENLAFIHREGHAAQGNNRLARAFCRRIDERSAGHFNCRMGIHHELPHTGLVEYQKDQKQGEIKGGSTKQLLG